MTNNILRQLNISYLTDKLSGNVRFFRNCLALFVFGFLIYFLISPSIPNNAKFEVGKPAPFDARAEYSVRLVDEKATQQARQNAAEQTPEVETFNPYAIQISEARIDNTISLAHMTLPEDTSTSAGKTDANPASKASVSLLPTPLATPSPTAAPVASPSSTAKPSEKASASSKDAEAHLPEATPSGMPYESPTPAGSEVTDSAQTSPLKDVSQTPLPLSSTVFNILVNASDEELEEYSNAAKLLLRETMNNGIREAELGKAAAAMIDKAAELKGISSRSKVVAIELASKALIANRYADKTATATARREAAEQVIPIVKVILPGQIVVREGEIVEEEDVPVLEALDFYHRKLTVRELLIKSLLVIVLMSIAITFVIICVPRVYEDVKRLSGLALIVFIYAIFSHSLIAAGISPQITPITIPAILIAILYDSELSILISILLVLYSAAETSNLSASSASILTSMVAVLSVKHVNKRWDLIRSAIIIWGTSVLCNGLFSINLMDDIKEWASTAAIHGTITGLLFSLLASGMLPFLESILDVVSHMRLLELSNPSEPALHELLSKAPGTYQHSLMVSNLAATAAQEVGADSLLCRTGAFYHDIGKTKQPHMFIENQFGDENPHDKLSPSLSAMILISHVRFGQEMASHYKLPKVLRQFISEHHGTNLASFFYQKAKELSDEPLSEDDFRYPGPKPQSKETAIVMICDTIEAAARTLPSHTKEAIQALVERLVSGIISNGQLSECDLSLRDIDKIKQSVTHVLTSHYHSRISYPNMPTAAPAQREAKPSHQEATGDKSSKEPEAPAEAEASSEATSRDDKLLVVNQPEAIEPDLPADSELPLHTSSQATEKPRSFPAAQRTVAKNHDALHQEKPE
ncbi:HDIG domain-containing protein [bacterium]|nr:HDIG domain-containing protein [bacterium]